MPVESITPEQAPEYFGWLANLAQIDLAGSSVLTRQQLGWNFSGPDLLTALRNMDYSMAWGAALMYLQSVSAEVRLTSC